MRKIINPFENQCFGCSPANQQGLKMSFQYDEANQHLVSLWKPDGMFQGYENVLHGGIQATLVDEIAAWSVYVLVGTSGVTKALSMRYKKPVFLNKGAIKLVSQVKNKAKRSTVFSVTLYDADDVLCTTGEADYFIYPVEIARKKFRYPGVDEFFEKK